MRLRVFLSLVSFCACVHAQVPPAAAPLPGTSGIPQAPPNLRMPGADHRACGPTKWSALCAAGRWTLFSTIDLRVKAPSFDASYEIEQSQDGEMHATYRERIGKDTRGGEAVLFGIDGFAYRSREAFPDPGDAIDYMLSSPIMMAQLAALLLDLGVIGPPSDVTAPRSIDASSATQYIRTAAPRQALLYGPPWSMTGKVRSAGPGKVGFDLRLRFHPVDRNGNAIPDKTDVITLEGTAAFTSRRAMLPDTMDLTGWKVMRAGVDAPLPDAATLEDARRSLTP
jgi:hypothetical protein